MAKKLTFTVEVHFNDKINDDNHVLDVAKNIANAIENEANGMGIAPEDSETFTLGVSVKPQFIDKVVTRDFV